MKDMLTVSEAAKELNLSPRRIHDFIKSERLPAEKFGSYYLIKKDDLELVRERIVGRPKKSKDSK